MLLLLLSVVAVIAAYSMTGDAQLQRENIEGLLWIVHFSSVNQYFELYSSYSFCCHTWNKTPKRQNQLLLLTLKYEFKSKHGLLHLSVGESLTTNNVVLEVKDLGLTSCGEGAGSYNLSLALMFLFKDKPSWAYYLTLNVYSDDNLLRLTELMMDKRNRCDYCETRRRDVSPHTYCTYFRVRVRSMQCTVQGLDVIRMLLAVRLNATVCHTLGWILWGSQPSVCVQQLHGILGPCTNIFSYVSSRRYLGLWSQVLSIGYLSLWIHIPSGGVPQPLVWCLFWGVPPARTGASPVAPSPLGQDMQWVVCPLRPHRRASCSFNCKLLCLKDSTEFVKYFCKNMVFELTISRVRHRETHVKNQVLTVIPIHTSTRKSYPPVIKYSIWWPIPWIHHPWISGYPISWWWGEYSIPG